MSTIPSRPTELLGAQGETAMPQAADGRRGLRQGRAIVKRCRSGRLSCWGFFGRLWRPRTATTRETASGFSCYPCHPWQRPVISNQLSVISGRPDGERRRSATCESGAEPPHSKVLIPLLSPFRLPCIPCIPWWKKAVAVGRKKISAIRVIRGKKPLSRRRAAKTATSQVALSVICA